MRRHFRPLPEALPQADRPHALRGSARYSGEQAVNAVPHALKVLCRRLPSKFSVYFGVAALGAAGGDKKNLKGYGLAGAHCHVLRFWGAFCQILRKIIHALGKAGECAPVHGRNLAGLQKTGGQGSLAFIHGKKAASGQQGQVYVVQRAPGLHVAENAGVSCMVYGNAVLHLQNKARGQARVAGVGGFRHGNADALEFGAAAYVKAYAVKDKLRRKAKGEQLGWNAHHRA